MATLVTIAQWSWRVRGQKTDDVRLSSLWEWFMDSLWNNKDLPSLKVQRTSLVIESFFASWRRHHRWGHASVSLCIRMWPRAHRRLGTKATQVGEGAVLGRKLAHFYFQHEVGNYVPPKRWFPRSSRYGATAEKTTILWHDTWGPE
jgi:hypothetical protein